MSAKTLIVLRHAKSSWRTPDIDLRRPLAERGIEDARAAGEVLSGYRLDRVWCSAATRAQQTWQYAVEAGAACDQLEVSEAIYHAWPAELLEELRATESGISTLLLIGHQPTLSELVLGLAAPSKLTAKVADYFPTSALAVLSFDGGWSGLDEGKATLTRYEIPRG